MSRRQNKAEFVRKDPVSVVVERNPIIISAGTETTTYYPRIRLEGLSKTTKT
jgi:hypothetical protein